MTLRIPFLGFAAVCLLVVASCATSPGMAPRMAPVGPEPKTVDEAQADIDRWGAQLGLSPTPSPGPSPTTSGTGPGQEPARPPGTGAPVTPSAPPYADAAPTSVSGADRASGDGRSGSSSNECATPCRAIASMRRSVAALCRIAGEDDPRCVNARRTLDEGERRVARCGC